MIILNEKTRRELIIKQKHETPERIERSKRYSISNVKVNAEAFLANWLVITTNISGNSSQYNDVIAFENVLTDLIEAAKQDSKHYVNAKLIQKSLKASLDKNDIYLDCTCQDWMYRYAYWSTKGKFKWGKLQNSNGEGIRNPHNDIGTMCKHLYTLLRSNVFLNHVSDKIMRTIMANLDVIVKKYEINLEEFIVNSDRYDRLMKMNVDRDKSGKFKKVDNSNNSENEDNSDGENNNEE